MMIKITSSVCFMRSRLSSTLYELAARHGGYFTTREAAQAGLSNRQLSYHSSSGELERVAHGVYRLVNYPEHSHGDMIVATLWAGPGSAVSHESALAVYGLAAAMPQVIHLSAPKSFTGSRAGVRIHHEDLEPDEVRLWDDVPVTAIERTLTDLSRSADPSLLREATRESLEQGLTTRIRLARAVDRQPDRVHIRRMLGVKLPSLRESA
jgi:predicted transcriptional regulator of viral defense system